MKTQAYGFSGRITTRTSWGDVYKIGWRSSNSEKENNSFLALKQKSFSNPILEKLSNNPDLLSRVTYQIEEENKPKYKSKL